MDLGWNPDQENDLGSNQDNPAPDWNMYLDWSWDQENDLVWVLVLVAILISSPPHLKPSRTRT